jgi:uncharacterized membrane protein
MSEADKAAHKRVPWLTEERMCAFTDGVIAIIITILVLQIDVPQNHDFSRDGVFSFLGEMSHDIIVYFVSFGLIGAFWLEHHVIFHYVARIDRTVVFLNMFFLFLLSLAPFTTELAGTYHGVRPAEVMFGINFLLSGVTLVVIWRYCDRKTHLLKRRMDRKLVKSMTRRIMVAPALILAGMFLSMYNFHLAAVIYLCAPLSYLRHWLADTSWQSEEDERRVMHS